MTPASISGTTPSDTFRYARPDPCGWKDEPAPRWECRRFPPAAWRHRNQRGHMLRDARVHIRRRFRMEFHQRPAGGTMAVIWLRCRNVVSHRARHAFVHFRHHDARPPRAVSVQSAPTPRLTKPCSSGGTPARTRRQSAARARKALQSRSGRSACNRHGPPPPLRERCRPKNRPLCRKWPAYSGRK